MRLWSEEKIRYYRVINYITGKYTEYSFRKFMAAWLFTLLALILTFPIWITVNYLGNPDNGVIMASYIGSFLMSGGYLSIGIFISSLTKNQVIAFIVSVTICFLFTVSGLPIVLDFFLVGQGKLLRMLLPLLVFSKLF